MRGESIRAPVSPPSRGCAERQRRDGGRNECRTRCIPAVALAVLAWIISRFAAGDLRDGILALGFAPAEVASVGLVGLVGRMAEQAIAVVGLSLVVSAVAGPPLLAAIAGGGRAAHPLPLLGHFALIVLLQFAAGVAIRGATPALERRDAEISLGSTAVLLALIFASLTATRGHTLAAAALASVAFLIVSRPLPGARNARSVIASIRHSR